MDYLNKKMKDIILSIGDVDFGVGVEDGELMNVLKSGFVCRGGGVFFSIFFNDIEKENLDNGSFYDISGYEFTINKFHIEDYCVGDLFFKSILFLYDFEEKWKSIFKDKKCIGMISFQEDEEYGRISVFSFYVFRDGENVLDMEDVESYEDAILIRVIC